MLSLRELTHPCLRTLTRGFSSHETGETHWNTERKETEGTKLVIPFLSGKLEYYARYPSPRDFHIQEASLLKINGVTLIDHTINLLKQSGIHQCYISGDLYGYPCIKDDTSFQGPATAINSICQKMLTSSEFDGMAFIPVDMPLLSTDIIKRLLSLPQGGFFEHFPLPLFVHRMLFSPVICQSIKHLIREKRHSWFFN